MIKRTDCKICGGRLTQVEKTITDYTGTETRLVWQCAKCGSILRWDNND